MQFNSTGRDRAISAPSFDSSISSMNRSHECQLVVRLYTELVLWAVQPTLMVYTMAYTDG